jgi:DUF1680 family protein
MAIDTSTALAAVLPTPGAISRFRPLDTRHVRLTGGFWADRLATNRERTIPHGFGQLTETGTLHNLRLAAGEKGSYKALGRMFEQPYPFLDSDVYKWLEAAGWELGRAEDERLADMATEAIDLVAAAQRDDGYINSFVQVLGGGRAFEDLAWGHELYCIGHLIQAAVAWHRALGDDRLLTIATRAADAVDRELGPSGRLAIEGHPEIEMALVELYRTIGEQRYLTLASRLVEARGHGLLGDGRFGAAYWQDHATVREAREVAGHAVRQLYLDSGVVDVAVELGDQQLLDAVHRRWQDMVATRTYITGGVGSRYLNEAFGDPYELPPDRAYAETCGAISSVMLAWRLGLATGDPACFDLVERTILNGVLPGVALDGRGFFYVNTLQWRTHRAAAQGHETPHAARAPWFPCACCPPNLMRTLASWPHYLATTDETGIQLRQYATAEIEADVPGGRARLAVETDYPWSGRVAVRVVEAPGGPWTLTLRIPDWCDEAGLELVSEETRSTLATARNGAAALSANRIWRAGDRLDLDLRMEPRVIEPDRRIDAVRGSVALERGPLVYCLESVDLPGGTVLEDVEVELPLTLNRDDRSDLLGGAVGLALPAVMRRDRPAGWPYEPDDEGDIGNRDGAATSATSGSPASPIEVRAIPYFAWANRAAEAMRVWIPRGLAERDLPR